MVILFDGVCNLCNCFVQLIIKRDKKKQFQFASLQSEYGKSFLAHHKLPDIVPETVILYNKGKVYTESDASIRVVGSLAGLWKVLYIFIVIPKFIRNLVYRLIAKNRYKLFGKREQCMVPSGDIKDRFLDNTTFRPDGE